MTRRIETAEQSRRIRVLKRQPSRRALPPLDLRTPSGRRRLPY
ncbi:hypothetical protein [Actinocrinis sp.]|nr:hypothetical protein [Actinocrinis sp.]HZP53863.1 hypothetical protein [Actinocrinis sp.]HZU56591.1 hypothetical protein [Actinocrinis sp.]